MRLGSYPCTIMEGSLAHQAYQVLEIQERHRHRFEFNNHYRDTLQANGAVFSGLSPDGRLVEITDLRQVLEALREQPHQRRREELRLVLHARQLEARDDPAPVRRRSQQVGDVELRLAKELVRIRPQSARSAA